MLELRNIYKSYTTGDFTQTALDGINLKFRENEFVAILGHSGSGKTTFLNVIGGLDRYDKGDLIINGKSTKYFKDSDWDAYRNNSVGFVFQNYNLIAHLSIVDNVEMGMTLSGVSNVEKHRKALKVLERVGLKDHTHKKPNQLSGGQMQRVAIARALANDPDIILADEPTGALDTATSVQIMNLIKEISEDKLVIMVTHNPVLAHNYAERIIEFKDGEVISDSNPLEQEQSNSNYKFKKTRMKFFTALKLSGKNIATKKWRTTLTAFASSIGIIGIALILSLSNGFDKQISKFENNTLSGFPILITQTAANINIDTMQSQMREHMGKSINNGTKYPDTKYIYPYDPQKNSLVHNNIFTDEYIKYIEKMDASLLSGISYARLVSMNIFRSDGNDIAPVDTKKANFTVYPAALNNDKSSYLKTYYDILAGEYPSEKTDLVLIVDGYNKLDISVLKALGFDYKADAISFDNIIGSKFKTIMNNEFYKKNGNYFTVNATPEGLKKMYDSTRSITLDIVGIIRSKKDNKLEVLTPGIAYSDELSKIIISNARKSDIVKAQKNVSYSVLTGVPFTEESSQVMSMVSSGPSSSMNSMVNRTNGSSAVLSKSAMLSMLGADGTPYIITLYPRDFSAKESVTSYLNEWNKGKDIEDTIIYTDLAETFTKLSGGIMDAITIVLIAFAAISLVVSLIMIGIITYISVLERTREIGVLRALGARKKDITRVFNAETFIIGTCSGILGIVLAYLLTIPVNNIIYYNTDLKNVAQLNPLHALLLVVISVALTLLGGVIPAKMAAKKDPVEALRSE